MNCHHCGKETTNPRFCSRSCAAKVTNKETVKRGPRKVVDANCIVCGCQFTTVDWKFRRRKKCDSCHETGRVKDITLGEAAARYSKHHPSSAYALVRTRARILVGSQCRNALRLESQQGISHSCERCGYSKHVEVCHIRPISSFPETAMLSEINSRDNIMLLCPNCHWEFDHP